MTSLPPVLLEQLLSELSTLASVYHKPPESFVGKGRYGADEIQRAAIQEQRQNAAEDPIAASVAAAAAAANGGASGGAAGAPQNNMENLLDIDFDGGAPASASEGGVNTPDRVASPAGAGFGSVPPAQPASSSMADMMGLFDAPAPAPPTTSGQMGGGGGGAMGDMMSGFAGMDLSGTSAPPPASQQLGMKPQQSGNDDLLGLF